MDEIKLLDVFLSNTAGSGQKTNLTSKRNPELFQKLLSAQKNGQISQNAVIGYSVKQEFQDEQDLLEKLDRVLSFLLNDNWMEPDKLHGVYQTKGIISKEASNRRQSIPITFQQYLQPDDKSAESADWKLDFMEISENNLDQPFIGFTRQDFQAISELFERLAENPELFGAQTRSGKSFQTDAPPFMNPVELNTRVIEDIHQNGKALFELADSGGEMPEQIASHPMSGNASQADRQFFQQNDLYARVPDIIQQDIRALSRLFASLANHQSSSGNRENESPQKSGQPAIALDRNSEIDAETFLQLFSSFMKNLVRRIPDKTFRVEGQPHLPPEQGLLESKHPESLVKTTSERNQPASATENQLVGALNEKSPAGQLTQNEREIVAKLLSLISGDRKETESQTKTSSNAVYMNEKGNGIESKLSKFFHLDHRFYRNPGTAEIGKQTDPKPSTGGLDENQAQVMQPNKSIEVQVGEPFSAAKRKPVLPDQIIAAWKQARFAPFGKLSGSFTIRLNPEHLGHLTVKIKNQNGLMTGRIIASTDSAKELLEHHLPLLKQALPNMPMQIERFSVPLQDVGQLLLHQHNEEGEKHSRQKEHNHSDDQENEPFQQFLEEMKIEAVIEDRREQL